MTTKQVGLRALADLLTPMAVRVAATLGVADQIAAGLHHPREIALRCGADPGALDRLLRHLATIGLVARNEAGGYVLTATGEELCSDHPGARRPWLDLNSGVGRGDLCFVDLLHTMKTGEPAYPVRYGIGFWEDLERDRELSASFDALMNHHGTLDNTYDGVAGAFPWADAAHVIDVGGGNGALACHLVTTYPTLHATVIDRAGPVARARQLLAGAGVADRAQAIVGDFFEPLPARGDVCLLSAILHDWDDERATLILRHCAEAVGADGSVLVVEAVGEDGERIATAMDLRMLAYSGGRERGVQELSSLAAQAGLRHAATHPLSGSRYMSVVEFRPASER